MHTSVSFLNKWLVKTIFAFHQAFVINSVSIFLEKYLVIFCIFKLLLFKIFV